ncbi:hypothetical protein FQN57_002384 [Myotisia sp. PD_48]|nr:hypothetical protein FQN57_002384 [Myotisia sp. PD_48]
MQQDKETLIYWLRSGRVKSFIDLRRIEKICAELDCEEVTGPMTSAWLDYVNSNNLLNELRTMTNPYSFSSECLDEAKSLVVQDPESTRSWNFCWLVLRKIHDLQLISKHARIIAETPATWGGHIPDAMKMDSLTNLLTREWSRALELMLSHWASPPTTSGK